MRQKWIGRVLRPALGISAFLLAAVVSGAPGFHARLDLVVAEPKATAAADFDGSGTIDLAVVSRSGNSVYVFKGDVVGGFTLFSVASSDEDDTDPRPVFVLAGQLNPATDSFPDLMVVNENSVHRLDPSSARTGNVTVLFNNGSGVFPTQTSFELGPIDPVTGPTARTPRHAALQDLDSDVNPNGWVDIVVSNLFDNNFSVLLSQGDGTFVSQKDSPFGTSGANPVAVAPAKLTRDPSTTDLFDMLTLNNLGSATLRINLGGVAASYPQFGIPAYLWPAAGAMPVQMQLADFDGDGATDVAVALRDARAVDLLKGDPWSSTGDYLPFHSRIDIAGDPVWLAVGDFSLACAPDGGRDGLIDIAVLDGTGTLALLEGHGNLTFDPPRHFPVGMGPEELEAADLNGDTIPDFVICNGFSSTVSVLIAPADSSGVYPAAPAFAAGPAPVALAAGDFDGDMLPDAAVGSSADGSIRVFLGLPAGGLEPAPAPIAAGSSISALAVTDFNADSIPDLVAADPVDRKLLTLAGIGDGSFVLTGAYATGSNPIALAAADFGSGRTDIAVACADDDVVRIFLQKTDLTYGPGNALPTCGEPSALVAAELNGDPGARIDLAVACKADNSVQVYAGSGSGTFALGPVIAVGAAPAGVAAGDLDGDFHADLAAACSGSGEVYVALSDGSGGFRTPVFHAVEGAPSSITTGDFDGDAVVDLAAADPMTDRVVVLLGTGAGNFAVDFSYGVDMAPMSLAAAAFDPSCPYQGIVTANQGGDSVSLLNCRPLRKPPFADAGPDATICQGAAGVTIGTPAVPGITYSWAPGIGLTPSATVAQPTANPASTTVYTVTVTDPGSGCTDVDTVVVVPASQAGVSIDPTDPTYCAGPPLRLDAGPWYTSYDWTPGGETTRTIEVSPASTTSYTVRVTDASGCDTTDSVTVTAGVAPTASAAADARAKCEQAVETTFQLNGSGSTGAAIYEWTQSGFTSAPTFDSPAAATTTLRVPFLGSDQTGTVTLTVHDALRRCSDSQSIPLTVSQAGTVTSVGNTLFVTIDTARIRLDWSSNGGTVFPVYRTLNKADLTDPVGTLTANSSPAATQFIDAVPLGDGNRYYYEVYGSCP